VAITGPETSATRSRFLDHPEIRFSPNRAGKRSLQVNGLRCVFQPASASRRRAPAALCRKDDESGNEHPSPDRVRDAGLLAAPSAHAPFEPQDVPDARRHERTLPAEDSRPPRRRAFSPRLADRSRGCGHHGTRAMSVPIRGEIRRSSAAGAAARNSCPAPFQTGSGPRSKRPHFSCLFRHAYWVVAVGRCSYRSPRNIFVPDSEIRLGSAKDGASVTREAFKLSCSVMHNGEARPPKTVVDCKE
jgi:hypothetical protein